MRKTTIPYRLAKLFGSQAEVARICGVDPGSVCRWTRVPTRHLRVLLDEAKARRIKIDPAELVA